MKQTSPTTEPCTTGVINELEGCEPVGVLPPDLQPIEVCYDTFENDDIPDCFAINGPAIVDLPRPSIGDECWIDSNPANAIDDFVYYDFTNDPGATGTHSISAMPCGPVIETSIADPPQLPATGLEETLAVGAGVLLVSGILLARLARKEHS